jgi:hypothetical protein
MSINHIKITVIKLSVSYQLKVCIEQMEAADTQMLNLKIFMTFHNNCVQKFAAVLRKLHFPRYFMYLKLL